MRRSVLSLVILAATAFPAFAGKFNKVLSIGDAAPAWEKLEGIDGKRHSLADLKEKDVVVVVFTCNTCHVAEAFENDLVAFANTYAGADSRVGFVAINVNTIKGEQLADMKARAMKKKFPFAYLSDPSQKIAHAYGANFTPEFFVLNKARQVVYMGAMVDKVPPGKPTKTYLADAVQAALDGKAAPTAESLPIGCRIRFNRTDDE